jgi:hypothetical protein
MDNNLFQIFEGKTFGSVIVDEHIRTEVEEEDYVVAFGLKVEGEDPIPFTHRTLESTVLKMTAFE